MDSAESAPKIRNDWTPHLYHATPCRFFEPQRFFRVSDSIWTDSKKSAWLCSLYFTYDEIARILAVVDGFRFNKCSPKRHIVYPLLFRVLCFCGLRISEALNLTVGDVHFEDGFFLLRNTKTSLDRLIPLDDNLRARFMAYSEQMGFLRKDEYFFPHRMVPDTVLQQWTQHLGTFFSGLAFYTAAREKGHGCMTWDTHFAYTVCKSWQRMAKTLMQYSRCWWHIWGTEPCRQPASIFTFPPKVFQLSWSNPKLCLAI